MEKQLINVRGPRELVFKAEKQHQGLFKASNHGELEKAELIFNEKPIKAGLLLLQDFPSYLNFEFLQKE